MAARTGSAVWEGTLKQGKGTMKLGSGAFEGPYSFSSRFESGAGTNPEELIAAAEAGCFSMALSANLEKAGHPAKRVSTTATGRLEMVGGGPKITAIDLKTAARSQESTKQNSKSKPS
jgi:osmotically inducible protein OsmC